MCDVEKKQVKKIQHNTIANTINAVHDGKVGFRTVQNTMALLYSDWLCVLFQQQRVSVEELSDR